MKKLLTLTLCLLLLCCTVFFVSCDLGGNNSEGNYYTKSDVDALIDTLEEALKAELATKIQEIKNTYDAKIESLEALIKELSDADHADPLDFYPLPDGTYGVMAGKTLYLSEVVIPATYNGKPVTQILPDAFRDATNLTSINIPASVESIGYEAFCNCDALTTVTFAEGSQCISIGNQAFFTCDSLTNINIPASVESICYGAFYNCDGLTTVTFAEGSQLTDIGDSAFWGCSSLTSITIPKGVTYIGDGAFYDCYKLIEIENGVSYVDKWVVDCDTSVTSVTLRSDTVGIGDSAFRGCSSLTSITIPEDVTSIGEYAFSYCSRLSSINYQGTVEQWENIDTGYSWNNNTGEYVITCTDGKIAKNGTVTMN